ncbi:MAG TPA: LysM domain-containing protein [Tepidisphaeraceae bacterium]|jgi:nucleoid-associated protein YgaU|nr:LysM domain-containing protein [Tepidisphaeraceae bacterium]
MRKDVKFGLTIGAILVVTLVVYVIVLSRGPSTPPKVGVAMPSPTDSQAAEPTDSTPTPSTLAHTEVADSSTADQQNNVGGSNAQPAAPEANAPAATQPTAATDSKSDWDSALNHGLPPSLSAAAPDRTVMPMIDSAPFARNGSGVSRDPNTPMIDSLPTTQPAPPVAVNAPMMDNSAAVSIPAPANLGSSNPQPVASSGPRTHRVAAGESPYSISQTVYGNSKYYKKILAANPGIDPHRLKIGQILVIPDLTDSERNPTAAAGAADPSTSVDSSSAYKVVPGDTLEGISRKLYGSSAMIDAIYQANKSLIGSSEDVLKVGWVLKLPKAPTVASAAR